MTASVLGLQAATSGNGRPPGMDVEADRRRAFAAARRHSRLVRILKIVLPACAGLSLLAYVASPELWTSLASQALPGVSLPSVEITPDRLRMINPRYEGRTADNGHYVVSAASAVQDLASRDTLKLATVKGRLVQADKSWLEMSALEGLYNIKGQKLHLGGGIDVVSSTQLHATLDEADLDIKSKRMASDSAVHLTMPSGQLEAVGLTYDGTRKVALLRKQVRARLVPPKAPAKAATAGPAPLGIGLPASLAGAGGGPIDIQSNQLRIDDAEHTATFLVAVRAVQGGTVLQTKALVVGYGARPGATPAPGQMGGNDIEHVEARESVRIVTADGRSALADWLRYERAAGSVHLKGNVVLKDGESTLQAGEVLAALDGSYTQVSGPGRIVGHFAPAAGTGAPQPAAAGLGALSAGGAPTDIEADSLEVSDGNAHAVFAGNVVVSQRGNRLQGGRLTLDLVKRHMQMTGPGRVAGTFEQGAGSEAGWSAAASETEPAAPPEPSGSTIGQSFAGLSRASAGPTTIEADSMTVQDDKGLAIFTGGVVAVRGNQQIRAEQLEVTYAGGGGSKAGSGARLVKIAARERVVVKAPDAQTATSDWLLYQASDEMLTMGGNVVVSQGKNVIHGDKLVVNLRTGESQFETGQGEAGQQADTTTGRKGRIQVLITPEGIKQMNGAGLPGSGGQPATTTKKRPKALSGSQPLQSQDGPQ